MLSPRSARIFDGCLAVLDRFGLRRWRQRTVAGLRGTVLELGAGSGRNAEWFEDGAVIVAVDPDFELLQLQHRKGRSRGPAVVAVAEALPFKDQSFDSCVATLVLCSVDDLQAAAREIRRTLQPGGSLHAIDHVASASARVRAGQEWVGPCWHRMTGGCRIDRPTLSVLRAEGFRVVEQDRALGDVFTRYQASPTSAP